MSAHRHRGDRGLDRRDRAAVAAGAAGGGSSRRHRRRQPRRDADPGLDPHFAAHRPRQCAQRLPRGLLARYAVEPGRRRHHGSAIPQLRIRHRAVPGHRRPRLGPGRPAAARAAAAGGRRLGPGRPAGDGTASRQRRQCPGDPADEPGPDLCHGRRRRLLRDALRPVADRREPVLSRQVSASRRHDAGLGRLHARRHRAHGAVGTAAGGDAAQGAGAGDDGHRDVELPAAHRPAARRARSLGRAGACRRRGRGPDLDSSAGGPAGAQSRPLASRPVATVP